VKTGHLAKRKIKRVTVVLKNTNFYLTIKNVNVIHRKRKLIHQENVFVRTKKKGTRMALAVLKELDMPKMELVNVLIGMPI